MAGWVLTLSSAAFAPGSVGHCVVLVAAVVGVAAWVWLGRASCARDVGEAGGPATPRDRLTRVLAGALAVVWAADLVQDAWPSTAWPKTALPLHLCDLAGVVAPLTLLTGRPVLRAILYFWALTFSTMAFVSPVVRTGPGDPAWWIYWLTHGGIIAAAAYDVAVLGYRPRWADWRVAAGATVAYAAFVAPLDGLLGANYGYVGDTARARESLVAAFGPWPARVPLLALTAVSVMAALTVPWCVARRVAARRVAAAPAAGCVAPVLRLPGPSSTAAARAA